MSGLIEIFRKEITDFINSKRFIILLLLVYLLGIATIMFASQFIRSSVTDTTVFIFLKLFLAVDPNNPSGELFLFVISVVIPVIGMTLGFDAVSSEKTSGNLSRLLSHPVYRDSVINGKFLAGLLAIAIMVVSLVLLIGGLGLRMIGVPPMPEEVYRLMTFVAVTVLFGAFWLALSILFSVVSGKSSTAILACLAIWFFFFLYTRFNIPYLIATSVFPVDLNSAADAVARTSNLYTGLNLISPISLYESSVMYILSPSHPFIMAASMQYTGLEPLPLPFGQSLLLVWPQLVCLVALTAICFAIAYINFMRQEIRAT